MFEQIAVIDRTGLKPWAIEELQKLSVCAIRMFEDTPASKQEIASRIGEADCVFVSWNTQLDSAVLENTPSISYIGMCCSLYGDDSANVDLDFTRAKNIAVTGIRDYGDEGVVEFVVSELVRLLKGIGTQQWRDGPVELANRKVGIVGLGTVGRMLADCLQTFGSRVYYFSRSRKDDAERAGIRYLPLVELLNTVEILSIHLPKNTHVLGSNEFDQFGTGKILINTSLGLPFCTNCLQAFSNWIEKPGNFAIMDGDGSDGLNESLKCHPRVIWHPIVAGWTDEAKQRLSEKVLQNVKAHLGI